jgi:hypothetical protein
MNGWLLVRIAGIVVGIATLLRVATNEGIVTYDPLFLAWMDGLSDIVELGFVTKLIGPFLHWGIDQVRSLGINVPDLQDEWRPTFLLCMLLFGALARHSRVWGLYLAVPVGALVFAICAGLTGSLQFVIIASFVGPIAFAVAGAFGGSDTDDSDAVGAHAVGAHAVGASRISSIVAAVAVVVLFGVGFKFGMSSAAFAAAVVFMVGCTLLQNGITQSQAGGWRAVFANSHFNIGIDILFTMAFAFVIAVAVANPPIW